MFLYKIELVQGGEVLVGNVCNEGSKNYDNIKKDIHIMIVGPNKRTSCLDRGFGVCNECGLSKYEKRDTDKKEGLL